MALIKINNSTITDDPVDLLEGELAYSETSGKLFIGSRDGVTIYTIGGQTDHDKLNQLIPGDIQWMWKSDTEPTDPQVDEGDLWYNTFSGEISVLRGITWEKITYDRELAGDFGSLTIDSGYF